MMNNKFQLNNPVVENILNQRYKSKNIKNLNEDIPLIGAIESIGKAAVQGVGLASQLVFSGPLMSIIKNLLSGTPEEAPKFVKASEQIINSDELNIPAPKMKYTTPSGFQLSRASTIA